MANFAKVPDSILKRLPPHVLPGVQDVLMRPGTYSLFREGVYGMSVPLGNQTWKGQQARLVGVWGGDASGNRLEVVARDPSMLSVQLVSERPVAPHLWAWIIEAKRAAARCPATYLEARIGGPQGAEYCQALPVDILEETARSSLVNSNPDFSTRDIARGTIVAACQQQGVTLNTQIAYILATVEHETAGRFAPVREGCYLPEPRAEKFRRGLRYYLYYGRGFVQLTLQGNYKKYSGLVDGDLVQDPDLALHPGVALFVLIHGMMHGSFGSPLPHFVNEHRTDFVGARHSVNGQDRAQHIADLAQTWLRRLNAAAHD
jgi:hypothetical protein